MRKLLLLGRPVVLVLVVLCPGHRLLSGAQQPASEASDQLIEYPEALSEEKIRQLEKWVKGKDEKRAPSSLRDIFGKETVAVPSSSANRISATQEPRRSFRAGSQRLRVYTWGPRWFTALGCD